MEFSNNINIKYIEFVKKTQYVYYEIEEGNNTYHGIIDIKNNLLIFNTNETIKNIRYFSTNSLLIITEKSAFKLCLFAKDIEIFFTLNLIILVDYVKIYFLIKYLNIIMKINVMKKSQIILFI